MLGLIAEWGAVLRWVLAPDEDEEDTDLEPPDIYTDFGEPVG